MLPATEIRSSGCKTSVKTLVKRLRNDFGSPLLPPPSWIGFWAAKILKLAGAWKVLQSSGMKISPLWSSIAFRPASTLCPAKFSSSSNTQSPAFRAARTGPSDQANYPALPLLDGKAAPSRSMMSVCSLKFTLTSLWPAGYRTHVRSWNGAWERCWLVGKLAYELTQYQLQGLNLAWDESV